MDPGSIEVLFSAERGEVLKVFFRSALSIDEAAQKTGVKANTLYRWVQKWCELGLLRVVAIRPKRGRPVKLYRTTAERFFVPYAATAAPTHEALLEGMDREFHEAFYKSLVRARQDVAPSWGFSFFVEDNGTYSMRTYKDAQESFNHHDPKAPATVSVWNTDLYLTFEEAKELQEKLYCFWHSRKKKPGARRYLIQLRLAPAAD